MKITGKLLAGLVLLLLVMPAQAVEPLSAEELNAICVTEQSNNACRIYVTGFLDGAIATDERVTRNVLEELADEESFSQRATRTRAYGRLRSSGPTFYAEFCVGSPIPAAEVIERVVEELDSRESLEELSARTIVYAALRRHYPCTGEG